MFGSTCLTFAQDRCPHDTMYYSRFINGSTTKTPEARYIYFGPEINTGEGKIRSRILQNFKNGAYVNVWKDEYVPHQPSGNYSEYIYSKWDSATAAWKPNYKDVYTYGSNNLWTELYNQEANQAGVLENGEKYTRTFNAQNRVTSYLTSVWDNGAWRNKSLRNFTYQADTLNLLELTQIWDVSGDAWVNYEKTERTFDASGREISNAQFGWDDKNNNWKGSTMTVQEYNQQGFVTSLETLIWNLGSGLLEKNSRTLYKPNTAGKSIIDSVQSWWGGAYNTIAIRHYTYNASNELLTYRLINLGSMGEVTQNFLSTRTLDAGNRPLEVFEQDSSSAGGGVWRPYRRWTYTYDANGNKLTEAYDVRQGNADTLSNFNRTKITYNSMNKILTRLDERYNLTAAQWYPTNRAVNEYNANGLLTASESMSNWDVNGSFYLYHGREEYICKAGSVGTNELSKHGFKVYPNPVENADFITIESPVSGNYEMIDLNGRIVDSGQISSGSNFVNISQLNSGLYILLVNKHSFKILVQ